MTSASHVRMNLREAKQSSSDLETILVIGRVNALISELVRNLENHQWISNSKSKTLKFHARAFRELLYSFHKVTNLRGMNFAET